MSKAQCHTIEKANGVTLLISYSTIVAAYAPHLGYVRTATPFSATTTRHINAWLSSNGAADARRIPQDELEAL